mmetsp:Transcript_24956/g.62558  ORF Transcript_24956/g.62558 Transcript_24956/m.62558 type:complete len:252 (+) Transcript_24956:454-1209(+)
MQAPLIVQGPSVTDHIACSTAGSAISATSKTSKPVPASAASSLPFSSAGVDAEMASPMADATPMSSLGGTSMLNKICTTPSKRRGEVPPTASRRRSGAHAAVIQAASKSSMRSATPDLKASMAVSLPQKASGSATFSVTLPVITAVASLEVCVVLVPVSVVVEGEGVVAVVVFVVVFVVISAVVAFVVAVVFSVVVASVVVASVVVAAVAVVVVGVVGGGFVRAFGRRACGRRGDGEGEGREEEDRGGSTS